VASVLSWLLSRRMAGGPPPLWAGHARQFQYSVAGLLGVSFLVSLALGVGRLGPAWGLAVRNTLCLGGPVVVYAWCLFRRRLGWVRLAIATLGLIALTLAMDFQYSGQFDAEVIVKALLPLGEVKPRADTFEYFGKHYARAFFSLTLVRAVVPVAGLMSGCVLLHAGGPLVRYYYPIVRDWRCEPRD